MTPLVEHLYLHTPFCASVCPYCAFYVEVGGVSRQDSFVEALEREIALTQSRFDWKLRTIYFGGGTPSLLSPRLFEKITRHFPAVEEFTLEANPATVTPAKAEAWLRSGVNRISLGAQSFDAGYLKLLGRQHQPGDIAETCTELRSGGFTNVSIDLMYALPNQPLELWKDTVEAALACGPQHLSCYGLTYEEDTPFLQRLQSGEWKTEESREIEMFLWTRNRLRAAGLPSYEISNFAHPGFESRHNRACWQGKDYLGLGPSASSVLGGERWKMVPDVKAYEAALLSGDWPRVEREENTPDLRTRERRMFGLRTREGVPRPLLAGFEAACEQLIGAHLAEWKEDALVLTEQGCLVADSAAELFA